MSHSSHPDLRSQLADLMHTLSLTLPEIQSATGLFSELLQDFLEEQCSLEGGLSSVLQSFLDQQSLLVKPLLKKNVQMSQISHDNYIKRSLDNYLRYFKNQENEQLPEESQQEGHSDRHDQVFRNIVPLRIDIEFDSRRYKENLLWNLDDQSLTGE